MMNDWIKNLKPGDEVIYSCSGDKSIEVVQKITPTGIVKTNMRSYNQYGSARGDYPGCIIECTPERKRKIVEESFVSQVICQLRRISSLSYDKAVAIKNILDQE